MKRLLFCLLGLVLLLAGGPVMAAKIITVDPESGEVTVIEKGGEEEPAAEEAEKEEAACPEDREKIERLTRIIRRQQEVILKQQAIIARQREDLQHKENIIQGLDMLRRQGR